MNEKTDSSSMCEPWMPQIPADWNVLPLFAVAAERKVSNAGMVENNLLSLSYGSIIPKDIDTRDGLLPESFETYQVVEPGWIVFRFTDLQNDKRSLRSGLVQERGIITSAYVAVEPLDVDSRFFSYLMRGYDNLKVFYGMGGGLRQSLRFADVKHLPILLPPRSDQTRIVEFLDRETAQIDALIAKQEALIALLYERRLAVIAQQVLGRAGDAALVDTGIPWMGSIPSHWQVGACRSISDERRGKNEHATDQRYLSLMANIGVIPYEEKGDVGNKKPEDLSKCKIVRKGDMVINSMNYQIGSYGLSRYDGVCSPVYIVLKAKEGVASRDYISHLFSVREFQRFAQSFGNGILDHRRSISWDTLKNLPVPLPPLDEQHSIAAAIDEQTTAIDTLVGRARDFIVLARERRVALVTAAVMGQVDFRERVA